MSSEALARFLAGSPDRLELLTHLADDPGAPADLADALSLSRRSVQRHLAGFVDRGLATKVNGAYRLTTTGELVAAEHASYLETLERVESHGRFFRHLPDAEHAPDPEWLADATVVEVTAENPQAPVYEYIDRIREFDADRLRMLSPVLSRLFHDVHAELALDGVHTELVMAADTVDRARDLNPAEFELVASVDVLDLHEHPGEVGVGLTLGDDRLLMGAYDDDGRMVACVHASNAAFLRWAEDLFERYRDRSERIEPSFTLPFSFEE